MPPRFVEKSLKVVKLRTAAENVERMLHAFCVWVVLNSPLIDSISTECQHQAVEVAVIVVMKKLGKIITIVMSMQ